MSDTDEWTRFAKALDRFADSLECTHGDGSSKDRLHICTLARMAQDARTNGCLSDSREYIREATVGLGFLIKKLYG